MKKTGKILIGVLSVGALIGTGYAAWHLNNGFVSTTSGNVGVDVNDMIINSFAKVVVEEKDSKLVFDGDHEDLTLAYNVKAVKNSEYETKDPYDLELYDKVASEYIPDLQVSVKAYDAATNKALTAEALEKVTTYITIPEVQEFSYTEWLSADAKTNGHNVNFAFGWSQNTFEGLNPQEYYKAHTEIARSEAETTIKDMLATLKGVYFKVHFDVGSFTYTEPDKSGEVTIPNVPGSTLEIAGLEAGKLTAGEHEIRIALEENKEIKDNLLTVIENGSEKKVALSEVKVRALGKTYTCVYNFLKDATYSFKYEVQDIVKYSTVTEGTHEFVTFTTAEGTPIDFKKQLAVGSTFAFKATANEGYKLEAVKHNDKVLTLKDGTYSFVVADGQNTISATASLIPVAQKYKVSLDSTSTSGVKLLTEAGLDLDLNTEYEKDASLKFKVGYNAETHTVKEVTLNGKALTHNGGVYTITISETNVIKVTLEEIKTPVTGIITIKEALAKENDTEVEVKGQVVSVVGNNFIIHDGTDYIQVYSKNHGLNEGETVVVKGLRQVYAQTKADQIGGTGLTITKVTEEGELVKPTFGEATVINEAFFEGKDEAALIEHRYISYKGKLSTIDHSKRDYFATIGTSQIELNAKNSAQFEENVEYEIKGFVSGAEKGIIKIFANTISATPTEIIIKNTNLTLAPEGELQLNVSFKENLVLNNEFKYELKEPSTSISVSETGLVKATAVEGTGTVKVTSKAFPTLTKEVVITVKKADENTPVTLYKYDSGVYRNAVVTTGYGKAVNPGDIKAEIFADCDFVTSAEVAGKVYTNTGSVKEEGMKFNSGSAKGTLSITLDEAKVSLTKVKLRLTVWSTDKTVVCVYREDAVNHSEVSAEGATSGEFEFDITDGTSNKVVIESKGASKQRFFIEAIEFIGTNK